MDPASQSPQLELPRKLLDKLYQFRRRVWMIKAIESLAAAMVGILLAFLLVFAFDRVSETSRLVRGILLLGALACFATIPLQLYRWIWRQRRLEQLARLLSRQLPLLGDQLLGVIELVRNDAEQARSRALCAAAIAQVADETERRDFSTALPPSRHRIWGSAAVLGLTMILGLAITLPDATQNAWARLLAPWQNIPRYTFTKLTPLPPSLVAAHGEPLTLTVTLDEKTVWQPVHGRLTLAQHPTIQSELQDGQYTFQLPAPIHSHAIQLQIGDARHRMRIEPVLRPELSGVAAQVELPEYLQRSESLRKDVRGGTITLVRGSQAQFEATANRELSAARFNQREVMPSGSRIVTPRHRVESDQKFPIEWEDEYGLSGRDPFLLSVISRDDEPPTLICEDLPRQGVLLDSEQLTFRVRARDDFGIRQVGFAWQSLLEEADGKAERGERILAAGSPDQETLELTGTFSARSAGISPQPIELRIWTEDYYPDRERVYSPPYVFYVLSPDQHAIWLTEQLSKWHRQSLEVRDRELQLYETNKQLRDMPAEALDQPEVRKQIESQAAAEQANGRRLAALTQSGEELVRQAARNPEFGVGHLERWAEMLQILQEISDQRMPSVAELLLEAAQAQASQPSPDSPERPTAGQIRAAGGGDADESGSSDENDESDTPAVPAVVDVESTQQPREDAAGDEDRSDSSDSDSSPGGSRLTLAATTLMGVGGDGEPSEPSPAGEKMEQAVREQGDLLAEFEKVADELNRILANLEGSTLVKRLKAAARTQYDIAGEIAEQIGDAFGLSGGRLEDAQATLFRDLAERELASSQHVSTIMDDMQAYFERRRFVQFKSVLDEMRELDVVGSLRQLGDDVEKESGLTLAQCEFWSDTLDRWAEDLVDPACSGSCPGGKSPDSLPPSIVLEVLQILEGEVDLREETRVAEQARPAHDPEDYVQEASRLSMVQDELRDRTEQVIGRILELEDAEEHFLRELQLLAQVERVMDEAVGILQRPETGSEAIAAETEAIELLLQSRRINPSGGGGGGGSTPGGGDGGDAMADSALAMLGRGRNEREVREDRGIAQTTGDSGSTLPEEFRSGLDQYFNRLEQTGGTP
jgi:hypothetical protein